MISRILAVTICLALLVPACMANDKPAPPAQQSTVLVPEKTDTTQSQSVEASSPDTSTPPGQLSKEEESQLSARSQEPGPEVAGGALSNLHLTYAVIALAAIILVLLIK